MRIYLSAFLVFIASIVQSQSLKIGIVADCQYCDCGFSEEWNNDYRQGPARLHEAVDRFNAREVDLVFHLGDFIDRDFESFATVKHIMGQLKMPHYYVLGNHEFSVADSLKKKVYSTLNLDHPYYTVRKNEWLFIVLDGTDISPYNSSDSTKIKFAIKQMESYANQGRPQAKPWNGAIGRKQMLWLEGQLKIADNQELNAIVLAHFPVLPKAALNLWNDVEVVQVLEKHNSVKAYFNGHHHPGNYEFHGGIHYVTFNGMVRTKEETAYAIITLFDKTIEIEGEGREPNRSLKIKGFPKVQKTESLDK